MSDEPRNCFEITPPDPDYFHMTFTIERIGELVPGTDTWRICFDCPPKNLHAVVVQSRKSGMDRLSRDGWWAEAAARGARELLAKIREEERGAAN